MENAADTRRQDESAKCDAKCIHVNGKCTPVVCSQMN
jgi:hypothetical protein